ncbi:MAG: hypothetical protein FJ308_05450 [Planctomycetes bacterium]|nr:hypothetical protein [Planctomycetota bacterium]
MFNIFSQRSRTVLSASFSVFVIAMVLGKSNSSSMAYAPHPFHVCIGQMEWNGSDRWEIALRVHPQDLEKELSKVVGKSISIEDDTFPGLVTDFLNGQFFIVRFSIDLSHQEIDERISEISKEAHSEADTVTKADVAEGKTLQDPTRSHLKWVGMESERGWIWIYLELFPPRSESVTESRDWLVHQLFLETVERQENSVVVYPQPRTNSARKYSLQFKKGQPSAMMRPHEDLK